jgi:hypothetical protein
MLKQVFFLAKQLKKSLNQASQQGDTCFFTVARLDGELGLTVERRQKAEGRRQKEQLQGDFDSPRDVTLHLGKHASSHNEGNPRKRLASQDRNGSAIEDRQIGQSSHSSEETSEDVTSAYGGGFRPISEKEQATIKPSALCPRTSAFQGGSRGKNYSAIAGGLLGLTKALRWEWESVYCRAIDLSPDLDAQTSVKHILAELQDPNRLIAEVGYSSKGRSTLLVVSG